MDGDKQKACRQQRDRMKRLASESIDPSCNWAVWEPEDQGQVGALELGVPDHGWDGYIRVTMVQDQYLHPTRPCACPPIARSPTGPLLALAHNLSQAPDYSFPLS